MTHALPPQLDALARAIPVLRGSDREFALSLFNQATTGNRRLSDKQWFWVDRLAKRAAEPPRAEDIVETDSIKQLFDRAAKNLKFPAIVLGLPGNSGEIRVSLASETSRNAGALYIKRNGEYLGKVDAQGAVRLLRETPHYLATAVTETISRFAATPAEVAAEHGKLTGRCFACNLPLTDERSTAVGYGKTCAANWGLPWGKTA